MKLTLHNASLAPIPAFFTLVSTNILLPLQPYLALHQIFCMCYCNCTFHDLDLCINVSHSLIFLDLCCLLYINAILCNAVDMILLIILYIFAHMLLLQFLHLCLWFLCIVCPFEFALVFFAFAVMFISSFVTFTYSSFSRRYF